MSDIQELKFSPAVFDPNKEQLQAIALEVSKITADPAKMTKEDLELINTTKNKLVKARTTIEKRGKEVRAEAIKFQKDVIAYEDELIGIIEPEEKRIKEIESSAKQYAMRQERLKTLPEYKAKLAAIGDGDTPDKWLMAEFDKELPSSEKEYDDYLLTLDPNQRDVYYNARLGAKLESDREEADKKRVEEDAVREAEAKKIQEEKDAIENEKKSLYEKKFNFRMQQLLEMGLRFNGEAYIKDDINVSIVEMKADSDEQFSEKISKIKLEIVRREKVAEEQAEIKRVADLKEATEKATREAEEKAQKEKDDAKAKEDARIQQEKEEADKRTKAEKYNSWLKDNSYDPETDVTEFKNGVTTLYRKVAEYKHE